MKIEYPTYKRGELESYYGKLSKSEKKIIEDFISYCSISAGKNKLEDIKRSIVQFRHITEKPFDKIDLETLRKYLSLLNKSNRKKYTANGIKVYLKRFLKWKFQDWPSRFEELKDIRLVKAFNEEKINEGTLLKKEQVEKIIKKEKDLTKKTFFITLYESGLRPIELRSLKWKDINFNVDNELSEIHIYSTKTSKARTVYVKASTFYLQKLREEKKSDYVFYSREDLNFCISKATATLWIKSIGKKANITLFPYLLRHSRATELYLNMPSKVAQKFMGHSKDMSDFYAHLSSKDVKEATLKTVYNFEELPPEKKHELEKEIEALKQKEKAFEEFSKTMLKEMVELKNKIGVMKGDKENRYSAFFKSLENETEFLR